MFLNHDDPLLADRVVSLLEEEHTEHPGLPLAIDTVLVIHRIKVGGHLPTRNETGLGWVDQEVQGFLQTTVHM